jgi:hypothetical protein
MDQEWRRLNDLQYLICKRVNARFGAEISSMSGKGFFLFFCEAMSIDATIYKPVSMISNRSWHRLFMFEKVSGLKSP